MFTYHYADAHHNKQDYECNSVVPRWREVGGKVSLSEFSIFFIYNLRPFKEHLKAT